MELIRKKKGLPEDSEIVMCEVTKVYKDSVFVNILEYNVSGMLHISEISAGRIRNLADYVKEGKIIICKVLKVDPKTGNIDLSLRRVNESQRRLKAEQIKREQMAEKILDIVAKDIGKDKMQLYDELTTQVFQEYEYLSDFFEDVSTNETILNKVKIDEKVKSKLLELIKSRIKPKILEIKGEVKIKSYEPNGIDIIKEALKILSSMDGLKIKYLGGGEYMINLECTDIKQTERKLETYVLKTEEYLKKHNSEFSFKRME